MPKSALINAEKADAYAREFRCLTRREHKLICTLFSTEISYGMQSQVIQHIKTERHKSKQQLSERQTLLSNCPQTNYFAIDLCNEFVSANIPIEKLRNTLLKAFLENTTKTLFQHHQISETFIFLRHMKKKLENLRLAVANHPFSVSTDETTDVCRRYVANIVLKDLVTGKKYLAHTEYLDATNFSSIATCLMNGLQLIYPNGIQYSNALILVTDWASYKTYCNLCSRR